MITITKQGKNLWRPEWIDANAFSYEIAHTSNSVTGQYNNWWYLNGLYTYPLKPNTNYTFSLKADNAYTTTGEVLQISLITAPKRFDDYPALFDYSKLFSVVILNITLSPSQQGDYYIYTQSFETGPYEHSFALRLAIGSGEYTIPPTTYYDFQLEEGPVATEYEEPWVNTQTFDDNLMTGEYLQKTHGLWYIHKNWYRDNQNNNYELLTFANGMATPSALTTEPVIVEDVATGEIKPAMVSGSATLVYFNQYDSWTVSNSTTSAFTLSHTSLNDTYPVAINDTVTTSGFTQSTTQVVFNNPVVSGSSVSVNYPVLDTYSDQAKVYYKVDPVDEPIIPEEKKTFTLLYTDNSQLSTTNTTLTQMKTYRIDTTNTNISQIRANYSIWNATTAAVTTGAIYIDGISYYTATTSGTTETFITTPKLGNLSEGVHTISLYLSTSNASYSAYTQLISLWS